MTDPIARLNTALEGRYRINRELGQGGMATVYLASDLKHDRKVALKVLKPELAAVLGADRFVQEIKTTANLQHPHILPLFDSGTADGFLYYVMPYIDGETLREKLDRETQLGVDEAVKIATEVADALDYAHRKDVIHRDIKPENILLHEGRPMVADFGIALAVSAAAGGRMTETGLSLGTPHYMSPEQATVEKQVTHRSDLYSLGCVLYEMLTGDPPHTGSSAQQIILKIVTDEPRPVTELRKSVPPSVAAALEMALEKLPADRFETAKALVDALIDPHFRGPRFGDHGDRDARPSKSWAVPVLVGVAVLAGVLAIWGWMGPRRPEGAGEIQYLPLSLSEPPRGRGSANGIELAPRGDRIAYPDVTGEWWLLDLLEDGSRPLGIGGLWFAFSPSGDSVAYTTSHYLQQIYVVDLASGRATQVADSLAGKIAWNQDGWIYYTEISELRRVRVSDGTKEVLAVPEVPGQWHPKNPAPLPNGRGVLYTRTPLAPRNPARAEIFALDLRSGESRVLTNGVEAKVTPSGHILVAQVDGSLLAGRFDMTSLELRSPLTTVLEGLEIRQSWGIGAAFGVGADGTLVYVKDRPIPDDSVVFVGRDGERTGTGPAWGGRIRQLAYRERDARWTASVHRGPTPHVFVTADDGGEPRKLTFFQIVHYYPGFIPRSDNIGFVAPQVDKKNWDLYRVPFDGSGTPTLIVDRPGDILGPRFTTDGRWVIFCEVSSTGDRDVVAHRFEPDSATVILVATDARECGPDVSPNNRWFAYTSDESGQTNVYVRAFDENLTTRWQVTTDGASTPRWSSTGTELFYVSEENEIVAVPVLGGESFEWGPPQVLFSLDEHSDWTGETAAGDQEFILIRAQREASGQVMLIRNFFQLLKEKVG